MAPAVHRGGEISAARLAMGALVAVALVQAAYYYPQLPETMASHFDGAGRPDGWSSKEAFLGTYLGIVALTVVLFGIAPSWLGRLSLKRVRIPNREYWLATERRAGTVAFIQGQLLWFGVANVALGVASVELVVRANLSETPRLDDSLMWAVLAYAAFLAGWLVRFIGRFIRTSAAG